ncbi:hypothetical protein [Aquimarina sp. I32.4]|uniref:hypothetical protein n=1 Tax=Aquimarina sp. I32.4 TaxID=2053903 RepID=UPI000CDEEC3B|nr:hypothetical protein [Aquimarina sp. I32.4]
MKLYTSVFFFLIVSLAYSQELSKDTTVSGYETLLKAIIAKDTLITRAFKQYECSEQFSGSIDYFYKKEKLKLIKHVYKENADVTLEYYYVQNDTLKLQTIFTEITRFNTLLQESAQRKAFSAEKVLDVTEYRTYIKDNVIASCYTRGDMQKFSEWDHDAFNALSFEKSGCKIPIDEINYKYNLLRKAEKKLINYYGQKPRCIFHLW